MQLIVGGAFAGKRKRVKEKHKNGSWVTAYEGDKLADWEAKWEGSSTLVIEGWEKWIAHEMKESSRSDDEIRQHFRACMKEMSQAEQNSIREVVLIMLEVGRGIVPITIDERRLRDIAGWVLQDAADVADEVFYVWHGLMRRLK
ncbi:bifunctional adenosylcobinamide kinase/adenosylcobinamide-phosphate guanylyltransferase [Alteribacter populi]|uniref:bifunctional adenosylcobinamide kinase/adenosylcobinamide-phosphate guanylyltransferase n=1 Tax=Alteribacter populi TaxID=2011011 RepID=UPI000BBB4FA9|nr:bifunctional adenosylcobinamide kinase/adenosylcobinamide-phosphate guanylyltransferase [Alteribacter populi]